MRGRWTRRLAAGLPALMSLLACASLTHTVEPYRSDPSQGAALQRRAAARCVPSSQARRETPEKPFVTDGCSAGFDREWVGCCVEHDIDYWCGGDAKARHWADRKLRRCVAQTAPDWRARHVYWGVRVGGHPIFPTHFRWGFGRSRYWPWYNDDVCDDDEAVLGPEE